MKQYLLLISMLCITACISKEKEKAGWTAYPPTSEKATTKSNQEDKMISGGGNQFSEDLLKKMKDDIRGKELTRKKKLEVFMLNLNANCNVKKLGDNLPIRITTNTEGSLVNYELMKNAEMIDKNCFDKYAVESQADFKQLRAQYNKDKSIKNKFRTSTMFLNK